MYQKFNTHFLSSFNLNHEDLLYLDTVEALVSDHLGDSKKWS